MDTNSWLYHEYNNRYTNFLCFLFTLPSPPFHPPSPSVAVSIPSPPLPAPWSPQGWRVVEVEVSRNFPDSWFPQSGHKHTQEHINGMLFLSIWNIQPHVSSTSMDKARHNFQEHWRFYHAGSAKGIRWLKTSTINCFNINRKYSYIIYYKYHPVVSSRIIFAGLSMINRQWHPKSLGFDVYMHWKLETEISFMPWLNKDHMVLDDWNKFFFRLYQIWFHVSSTPNQLSSNY